MQKNIQAIVFSSDKQNIEVDQTEGLNVEVEHVVEGLVELVADLLDLELLLQQVLLHLTYIH